MSNLRESKSIISFISKRKHEKTAITAVSPEIPLPRRGILKWVWILIGDYSSSIITEKQKIESI